MPFRRWLIPTVLVPVLAYPIWIVLARPDVVTRELFYGYLMMGVALLAALATGRAAVRASTLRMRVSFALFTLGLVLGMLNGLRLVLVAYGWPPAYGWYYPLRILALVLFSAALLFYPLQRRRISAAMLLMDVIVVASAVLVILWTLAFRPYLVINPNQILDLAFPAAGVVMFVLLVTIFLYSDSPFAPPAMAWLTLGLTVLALSAMYYGFLLRLDVTGMLTNLPNYGAVVGSFLIGLGGLSGPAEWGKARIPNRTARLLERLQRLLPIIFTGLVIWQILITWVVDRAFYPSGLLIVIIMALIIYARTRFTSEENEIRPYAALVNSVAEPAFVCDEKGFLTLVNPALQGATGYPTPNAMLGMHLGEILDPPETADALLSQALARDIDPEQTRPVGWSGEINLRRRNGVLLPVYLSVRPIQGQTRLPAPAAGRLALAGTAHDLTPQKKQQSALENAYREIAAAREALEELNADLEVKVAEETANLNRANQQLEDQNRKLQMLDRLKSDFVSLVSHELRAPLTNINGGIELVLSRPGPLEPKVRANLELVQSEISRLNRFVETILDLNALDAGRLPLYLAPVPYDSIVAILQSQLLHLPGGERILWEMPAALPTLNADERALTSVLFHLIDNALKYAPTGAIRIAAGIDGSQARIQVLDSGPGIPPEAMPLLFDRFYRLNAEDSQTVYGHGLGLYIVRRLVEAMGGRVEAGNRPEGGAVFTVWLRLAEETEESHAL